MSDRIQDGVIIHMQRTISTISLRNIFRTVRFAEMTRAFTRGELAEFLAISTEQAGRIVSESAKAGLIGTEADRFFIMPAGCRFLRLYREKDTAGLHSVMMRHPVYAALIDLLRSAPHYSPDEWPDNRQPAAFPFHMAELHMVCSWAEQIGSVQQNPYTQQYYLVGGLCAQFTPVFLKLYHQLEIPAGPADQKKPVPIHILREFVCQRLHIARDDFDSRVRDLCEQSPEEFLPTRRAGASHEKTRLKRFRRRGGSVCLPGFFPRNYSPDCIEINGRLYRFILCNDR